MYRVEEFVSSMGQRDMRGRLAVLKDANTIVRREEYVKGMVPYRRLAIMKDVPTKLRREEFARNTGQKGRLAAMRDAQSISRRVDFVKDITSYQMGRVWLYEFSSTMAKR